MYESEIEDLKFEIKELTKMLDNAESDYQYEQLEDAIYERRSRIKYLEELIEKLISDGSYWSDDDMHIGPEYEEE